MGYAQNGTNPVEVKFRYLHAFSSDYYISEISQYDDVYFKIDVVHNTSTTFGIESIGAGRYLIKSGTRYLFANAKKDWGMDYTGDFDEANGYFNESGNSALLRAVHAVRQDESLYILKNEIDAWYVFENEQVADYSKLEELIQSGKVKKIDLSQINNFVFFFSKDTETMAVIGETTYTIHSEIGVNVIVNASDGNVQIATPGDNTGRLSSFFIESENNFVPVEPDYGGRFGENNTFSWELKEGTLTVSGTGDMPDFNMILVPWYSYLYSITNMIITEGITTVRWRSSHPNLVSVTLSESLVSIGANAFAGSSRLTSVTVNWTEAEDLPVMGADVFSGISPDAVLYVPPGTKAIYEAAAQWKDFKTIKEQGVTAQPTPIRNSQGGFNVSLAVPETGTFTATFDVVLPAKFRLNDVATKLAESLASRFNLTITEKDDGVWSFEITPKAIRSASANPFREVVHVVYNVEKTLEDGVYELKIKSLELKLADGTEIREDEIIIPVTFNSATGNETPTVSRTAIWSYGHNLYITTPVAAHLSIFTLEGSLQKQLLIPAGETVIALPAGVYIVKAGDTVKKISIFKKNN
jgi:hypothetical protein